MSRTWRPKKIVQFPLTRIVLALAFVLAGVAAAQYSLRLLGAALALANPVIINLLALMIVVAATCVSYHLYVCHVEHRPVTELARAGAFQELSTGALIGMGLFTSTIGILWLLGYYRVTGTNGWPVVIAALAGATASAVV